MKPIETPTEMIQTAAMVRLAGELLESSGWRALQVTESWKLGPSSANLQPHGGWRHEEIINADGETEVVTIPSDVVGEHLFKDDTLTDVHARLRQLISRVADDTDELIFLLRKAVPSTIAVLRPDDLTLPQVSAAGWCTSCWTDGCYHEPVAMRPNGERRYRDHCLWCGEFIAAHDGVKPPLELLQARHRGDRISQQMVDQAFANLEAEKQESKADRKKRKKQKRAA